MIHRYSQWLEESEKIEAGQPAAPAPDATVTPPVTTDAQPAPAPETTPSTEPSPTTDTQTETPAPVPAELSSESKIEEYRKLDKDRRDSIRAFKEKNEEFLQIPDDIRKNPIDESDKTKVSDLKSQLTDLHQKMKEAIEAWDRFVSAEIGAEGSGMEEEP
jgi:hypothetical protein